MHSSTQRLSPTRQWRSEAQNLAKRDHRTKFISTESLNYKNTNSPPLNKKSAPLSLEIVAHDVFLQLKCACGEIGIRARLRIWCRETCRFESYQAHFSCGLPFRCTSKGIFCACSGKPRKTFGMNIPIIVHRQKTSCAFSPFRRPLARCSSLPFSTFGRKHKTPADF